MVHTSNSSSILIVSSLNIHSVFKITPYIHKTKETPDLSATNGKAMKPKLQGGHPMATFSVVPQLVTY
jgi:hypothetical protein